MQTYKNKGWKEKSRATKLSLHTVTTKSENSSEFLTRLHLTSLSEPNYDEDSNFPIWFRKFFDRNWNTLAFGILVDQSCWRYLSPALDLLFLQSSCRVLGIFPVVNRLLIHTLPSWFWFSRMILIFLYFIQPHFI